MKSPAVVRLSAAVIMILLKTLAIVIVGLRMLRYGRTSFYIQVNLCEIWPNSMAPRYLPIFWYTC